MSAFEVYCGPNPEERRSAVGQPFVHALDVQHPKNIGPVVQAYLSVVVRIANYRASGEIDSYQSPPHGHIPATPIAGAPATVHIKRSKIDKNKYKIRDADILL